MVNKHIFSTCMYNSLFGNASVSLLVSGVLPHMTIYLIISCSYMWFCNVKNVNMQSMSGYIITNQTCTYAVYVCLYNYQSDL